jgi:hypothetical protein
MTLKLTDCHRYIQSVTLISVMKFVLHSALIQIPLDEFTAAYGAKPDWLGISVRLTL